MLRIDFDAMEKTSARLEEVEQELESLARMLSAFESLHAGGGMPSSVLDLVGECRKLGHSCGDKAEELRKALSAVSARFLDQEETMVREIEQSLARALDAMMQDRALLSLCGAGQLQREMQTLTLGGIVDARGLPGVVPLDYPTACLKRMAGLTKEDEHGLRETGDG